MAIRSINTTLFIAALIGILFAYQAGNKHRQLLTEQTQLEAELGQMPITDPSKIYVLALETGEELHFAWRVHVPPGMLLTWKQTFGQSIASGERMSLSNNTNQYIIRVCIREDDRGGLVSYTMTPVGGIPVSSGHDLADLIRGHCSELHVEQLGSDGIVAFQTDEIVPLLRLSLPDSLKQKAENSTDEFTRRYLQTALFEIRFGSDQAFQQEAEHGEEPDDR